MLFKDSFICFFHIYLFLFSYSISITCPYKGKEIIPIKTHNEHCCIFTTFRNCITISCVTFRDSLLDIVCCIFITTISCVVFLSHTQHLVLHNCNTARDLRAHPPGLRPIGVPTQIQNTKTNRPPPPLWLTNCTDIPIV